jgi:hypothetical protein
VADGSKAAKSKKEPKASKGISRAGDVASLEKILSDFDAQPAQITEDWLNEIEASFTGLGMRRSRRAALATLAMSGMELTKAVADDRDAAAAFAVAQLSIKEYAARLREFADMMDSAQTRISVALCIRPDMEALLAEANAECEAEAEGHEARIDEAMAMSRSAGEVDRKAAAAVATNG